MLGAELCLLKIYTWKPDSKCIFGDHAFKDVISVAEIIRVQPYSDKSDILLTRHQSPLRLSAWLHT